MTLMTWFEIVSYFVNVPYLTCNMTSEDTNIFVDKSLENCKLIPIFIYIHHLFCRFFQPTDNVQRRDSLQTSLSGCPEGCVREVCSHKLIIEYTDVEANLIMNYFCRTHGSDGPWGDGGPIPAPDGCASLEKTSSEFELNTRGWTCFDKP